MILNKNKNEVDLSSILSAILFFFFFFFFFKSLFCYSFSLSTLIFTIIIIIIINHHYPIHFIHILISSKFHFFFLSIQSEPISILLPARRQPYLTSLFHKPFHTEHLCSSSQSPHYVLPKRSFLPPCLHIRVPCTLPPKSSQTKHNTNYYSNRSCQNRESTIFLSIRTITCQRGSQRFLIFS